LEGGREEGDQEEGYQEGWKIAKRDEDDEDYIGHGHDSE